MQIQTDRLLIIPESGGRYSVILRETKEQIGLFTIKSTDEKVVEISYTIFGRQDLENEARAAVLESLMQSGRSAGVTNVTWALPAP